MLRVTPGRIQQMITEGLLDAAHDEDGRPLALFSPLLSHASL